MYENLNWRKASKSWDWKDLKCVELALDEKTNLIACHNSDVPDGPVVMFTKDEIRVFFQGVKDGEFDDLVE